MGSESRSSSFSLSIDPFPDTRKSSEQPVYTPTNVPRSVEVSWSGFWCAGSILALSGYWRCAAMFDSGNQRMTVCRRELYLHIIKDLSKIRLSILRPGRLLSFRKGCVATWRAIAQWGGQVRNRHENYTASRYIYRILIYCLMQALFSLYRHLVLAQRKLVT